MSGPVDSGWERWEVALLKHKQQVAGGIEGVEENDN
jgi:hypothetical protein